MRFGRQRSLRPTVLCVLCCAALAHGLVAAEPPRGRITVTANGTTEVKPDVAEVNTAVTGNATLASDAIRKYRENRRRALELFHKLDVKNLVVEERGPAVTSVAGNNNQQAAGVLFNFNVNGAVQANPQAAGINCTESLVLRLPQIDRMKREDVLDAIVKMLDTCKDAGMTVGSVQFKSTKMEASRAAAVRAAVDAARQKAELLANLSHARAGAVLSIQENSPAPGGLENLAQAVAEAGEVSTADGVNLQVAASTALAAITLRAAVTVEFELERGH
jgi:uncharacterized protein YggE